MSDMVTGPGETPQEHAKALSNLGASKGGRARAEKLTPEQRSEIARNAALARWPGGKVIPKTLCGDDSRPLKIGGIEIPCYVLEDERRVLSQRGLQGSIGMSRSAAKGGARRLVHFIGTLEAKGLDTHGLSARANSPIEFITPQGSKALGYEATILREVCDVVLEARKKELLRKDQLKFANQCEILLRAFATVGIIALVDEATGYQDLRARDALAIILEKFIAKELKPWVRTFPTDFYKEVYRLRGWAYSQESTARPALFGKITNNLIYSRLAPGVLDELKRQTPRLESGRLKHHYHRKLTTDLGHPKLREHLASVVTIMKLSKDWQHFLRNIDQIHPVWGVTPGLPFTD